jgi:pyridoxal phosphate enzyme (YggS family)
MVNHSSEQLDVSRNLLAVRAEIAAAAEAVDRAPDSVTLVAVSKTHPPERVRLALEAGHRVFGENRVQEAEDKWPALKDAFPDARLHLIGPLQRNKVRRSVQLFDVIESVDRRKLARALANAMDEEGRRPDVLIQVNTGDEPQKHGVSLADVDPFVRQCVGEYGLPVKGLMCIPPVDEEPSLHFALLREIARRNGLAELSMGMTADYPVAVGFGATMVRVGTAIFGARPPAA